MNSTRQRLLDILKNRPGTTPAELSRTLRLTQADVRHHLTNMMKEGLIVPTGHQRSGRRGRPARRYSLASAAFKDNFDLLSSALLTTSQQHLSPTGRTSFLRSVAVNLAGEYTPQGPLAQRLGQAVGRLNELAYQARWEAHSLAPRMILEHCPFATLLPQHPELCQLDSDLLEVLLDESVTQIESRAHQEGGYCIFIVGKADVAQAP